MKTCELTDASLDYWVARAEGIVFVMRGDQPATEHEFEPEGPAHEFSVSEWKMWRHYRPSSNWADGGPIIDRADIWMSSDDTLAEGHPFIASCHPHCNGAIQAGPTKLIAAMRAYVASKFGEEIDTPTHQG